MNGYTVTIKDGTQITVSATRFTMDGSGVRFFDASDNLVAMWADGMVVSVVPVA